MIIFSEEDYMPLEQFRLKWRWTDPHYNQLPQSALSRIHPLNVQSANRIWEHSLELCSPSGLNVEMYSQVKEIDSSQGGEAVRERLLQAVSTDQQQVVISWDQQTAVVTSWGIFCEHWDDFCYASSDDVTIWPASEEWVLCYHHAEKFYFGRRHV
jgi:hypothetical protein